MSTINFSGFITGTPPKRDDGMLIGFDANEQPYVMRWSVASECYCCSGFDLRRIPNSPRHDRIEDPNYYTVPWSFLCRGDLADFIIRYVRVVISEKG